MQSVKPRYGRLLLLLVGNQWKELRVKRAREDAEEDAEEEKHCNLKKKNWEIFTVGA